MSIEKEMEGTARCVLPEKEKLQEDMRKKVMVIAGPTAVGKTALSIVIARALGGEVISADSCQVYRGMDIGTAKITLQERGGIIHHLIDSRDLDEGCNVVEFYAEATQAIKEIHSRGGVPIVVGGTGFYLHALIYGPPSGPPSDPSTRRRLEADMELRGPEALYDRLCHLDPVYAASITPYDRHKIIRALEIMVLSGKRVSDQPKTENNTDSYDFRCWFIYMERQALYPRIDSRCDLMIEKGLLAEVEQLEKKGLKNNLTAAQAIGYRQLLDYLHSPKTERDWAECMRLFKQASRHYAKRQFTWFRKEPLFRWLDVEKMSLETVSEILIQDFEGSF